MDTATQAWNPLEFRQDMPGGRRANTNAVNVPQGYDDDLFVEFSDLEVIDDWGIREKSVDPDNPDKIVQIPEMVTMITIRVRGNNKSVICRRVKLAADQFGPSDPDRFPRQWTRYQQLKAGKQSAESAGMPLSELGISKSHVEALASNKIYCVEDIAIISDGNIHNLGLGAYAMREKARKMLKVREAEKIESEKSELLDRISKLEAKLGASGESVNGTPVKPRRKPGPKPKIKEELPPIEAAA